MTDERRRRGATRVDAGRRGGAGHRTVLRAASGPRHALAAVAVLATPAASVAQDARRLRGRGERARTRFDSASRETTGALSASARAGRRRYGAPGRRLRPLVGAGLLGSYRRDGDDFRIWAAGAYGETGAAYFLTPHVSLGAAGELQAIYTDQRRGRGGFLRVRSVRASGTLVRVLGAVYF